MNNQNRKLIAIISFLKKFISVFFSLFLNIYVLKIVDDIGLILKFNLVGIVFDGLFSIFLSSILSSKNAKMLYNASFIELVLCIILLITLKESICHYLYLFRILYALTKTCYAVPYEMVVMGANNQKTMHNFLANIHILGAIATIFTPLFSGFIIEKFSYSLLFILLSIEAIFILLLSSQIKSFYVTNQKLNLKCFFSQVKIYPHLRMIYKCMFFRRISFQGAITDLLPVLLFLKTGSELSVGGYNSIFAIISIFSLTLLKLGNKKSIQKKFYGPFAILIFLSSLLLVFYANFVTLLIYYILMNSLGVILESESCSAVYEAINSKELSIYKREHQITFNIYMLFGQVISYGFSLFLYTFFYHVSILSIAICIMMFFSILSAIYLQRTEKYFLIEK